MVCTLLDINKSGNIFIRFGKSGTFFYSCTDFSNNAIVCITKLQNSIFYFKYFINFSFMIQYKEKWLLIYIQIIQVS